MSTRVETHGFTEDVWSTQASLLKDHGLQGAENMESAATPRCFDKDTPFSNVARGVQKAVGRRGLLEEHGRVNKKNSVSGKLPKTVDAADISPPTTQVWVVRKKLESPPKTAALLPGEREIWPKSKTAGQKPAVFLERKKASKRSQKT